MGLAIRRHILTHYTGRRRTLGAAGAGFAALMAAVVFLGQIFGKWEEGGWVRLISFTILFSAAHLVLLSPYGHRNPRQIHRIVREKARVQGAMASIVEWQALRMQEYRYSLLAGVEAFFEWFGVRRPVRYEPRPAPARDYDHAIHIDHPEAPSLLDGYLASPVRAISLGLKPNGGKPAVADDVSTPDPAVNRGNGDGGEEPEPTPETTEGPGG
jgi:hypothetical protein